MEDGAGDRRDARQSQTETKPKHFTNLLRLPRLGNLRRSGIRGVRVRYIYVVRYVYLYYTLFCNSSYIFVTH